MARIAPAFIAAIALAVILAGCGPSAAPARAPSSSIAPPTSVPVATRQVVYRLLGGYGTITAVVVYQANGEFFDKRTDPGLAAVLVPWEVTLDAKLGTLLSFTAARKSTRGTLGCEILADGVVLVSVPPDYVEDVQCRTTLPYPPTPIPASAFLATPVAAVAPAIRVMATIEGGTRDGGRLCAGDGVNILARLVVQNRNWVQVEVMTQSSSTCPNRAPVGTRGWLSASEVQE